MLSSKLKSICYLLALAPLALCTLLSASRADVICMSDKELNAYLLVRFFFSIGVGAGTCARTHPSLKQQATKLMTKHGATLDDITRKAELVASRPFQRAFPKKDAVEILYSRIEVDVNLERRVYASKTTRECRGITSFLEVASHLKQEAATPFIEHMYPIARPNFPRCR